MKQALFIAFLISGLTIQSVIAQSNSNSFGIYITTVFQAYPQNGLSFSANLQALQNIFKKYSDENCPNSNVSQFLIKHSLDSQENLLNSLISVISKYEISTFPKITLDAVTKQSLQKYSKGSKFVIPKSSTQPVQNYFLIELGTIVADFSCKFIQFHYKRYVNYFRISEAERRTSFDDSPYQKVLPMTGFLSSGFNYKNQTFQYTQNTAKYYSIMRTNGAFVSRHLMDLYFIEIQEISKLRQLVKDTKDCENIALNFIVGHFYLQIPPLLLNVKKLKEEVLQKDAEISDIYQRIQRKLSQQYRKSYDNVKSRCIAEMSKIMGYVPLKSYNSTNPFGVSNWKNPSFETLVTAKRVLFENILQGNYTIKRTGEQLEDKKNKQIIQKSLSLLNEYEKRIQKAKAADKLQLEQKQLNQQKSTNQLSNLEQEQFRRVENQAIYSTGFLHQELKRYSQKIQARLGVKPETQTFIERLLIVQLIIAMFLGIAIWRVWRQMRNNCETRLQKVSDEQQNQLYQR